MVKIISLGKDSKFIHTCENCHSTFEYELSDLKTYENSDMEYIDCPACKSMITDLKFKLFLK